jgi:hypothetical protein
MSTLFLDQAVFNHVIVGGQTGTFTVPKGATYVDFVLIGAGGDGGVVSKWDASNRGDLEANSGGGGGGSGAVTYGTIAVSEGDTIDLHAGRGNDSRQYQHVYDTQSSITYLGTTITAAGGSNGSNTGGSGGAASTGLPSGVTSIPGGDGGDGGTTVSDGADGFNQTTAQAGNNPNGTANNATPGSPGADSNYNNVVDRTDGFRGGGGGGAWGGIPDWAHTLMTAADTAVPKPAAGDGGDAATTATDYRDKSDLDTYYKFDGGGEVNIYSEGELIKNQFGCGGGGSALQADTNEITGGPKGGTGGDGIILLQYEFADEAPVITINGGDVSVEIGETYQDLGASAYDTVDTDVSNQIVVSGVSDVDTTTAGDYFITYEVADSAGNVATATRKVTVTTDATPPTISLIGSSTIYTKLGVGYTDPGATAIDNIDGELTPVQELNDVDVNTLGTYTVRWSAQDAAGNLVTVERTVIVTDSDPPQGTTPPPLPIPAGENAKDIGMKAMQNATQLYKNVSGSSGTSAVQSSISHTDAGPRYHQTLSTAELRDWFIAHGYQGGGTYETTSQSGNGSTLPAGNTNLAFSKFKDYGSLAISTQIVGESFERYYGARDAEIHARIWGSGGAIGMAELSVQGPLEPSSSVNYSGGWSNMVMTWNNNAIVYSLNEYSDGTAGSRSNIGGGWGKTEASAAQKGTSKFLYSMAIRWTNPGGSQARIQGCGWSIGIAGRTGSTFYKHYSDINSGVPAMFGTSYTTKHSLSNPITFQVGFNETEDQ